MKRGERQGQRQGREQNSVHGGFSRLFAANGGLTNAIPSEASQAQTWCHSTSGCKPAPPARRLRTRLLLAEYNDPSTSVE
jgi:hypothetical protein